MKITKKTESEGNCGNCSSDNINYYAFQHEGEYGYYPYKCHDCGSEGKEYYNFVYDISETTIELG